MENEQVDERKPKSLELVNEEPSAETETPKENVKLKEENSHFKQIVSDVIKSLPENGSIQLTSDNNEQAKAEFDHEPEMVSEENLTEDKENENKNENENESKNES